jgi:REP element-mobilizing transposase RayT
MRAMIGFHIYRGKLPHWREEGRTYFVTWRVRSGTPDLTDAEREIVATALRHFHNQRYRLHAFVVMNDHVHALVTPLPGRALEKIVGSWKSYTTRQFWDGGQRKGAVWQSEFFDRIVRDEAEFIEKARYIQNNPFKRWAGLDEYRWMGMELD